MLRRQLIAAGLLCTLMCASSSYGQTGSASRPANSFRSELWRMEFHEDDEKQKNEDPAQPDLEDADPDGIVSKIAPKPMAVAARDVMRFPAPIPGQTQLSDLQAETPFAEWEVDEGAKPESREQDRVTSAWILSQASGGESQATPDVLSKGPCVLTFLVAVVAALVMIGAIFSGRE
jgi:hypothetical protein